MDTQHKAIITVEKTINASVEKVWSYWTKPEHITKWNSASNEWHSPRAENDLRPGGSFVFRMEAKDGSTGFDFGGVYDAVDNNKYIEYILGDGRKVTVTFSGENNSTNVVETFEAESSNSIEIQKAGWQAILDNFKNYTENN
jgi:uncharacterized protein YndB with AHSA1/START domain